MDDDEFTPTTEQAREAFILGSDEEGSGGDFDRWLRLHDAAVRAETARAVAQRIEDIGTHDRSPASHWIKWMRHLADSGSNLLEPKPQPRDVPSA